MLGMWRMLGKEARVVRILRGEPREGHGDYEEHRGMEIVEKGDWWK